MRQPRRSARALARIHRSDNPGVACLEQLEDRLVLATPPAGFVETPIASGLGDPTAMEIAPDGRIFITTQSGALRVVKDGALLSTPFLSLTVDPNGERGLLGVAFDPNFASNKFLYVYYTVPGAQPGLPSHNRVSRFTANGDVVVPGSEVQILNLEDLSGATNHNGGAIHFGPDGKLYVAVGDNANSDNSQTLANRLGKMLRINSDGSIPADNPFFNTATGNNRAIWALGLRNPFTFGFDPATGRMFINDVGQSAWEEINDGIAGSNYGWPTFEGNDGGNPNFRDPLFAYPHTGGDVTTRGCAIVGAAFYSPTYATYPAEYQGDYFFADLCNGWVRRYDQASGNVSLFATGISSPVDLKVDALGSLYYLARGNGGVLRRFDHAGVVDEHIFYNNSAFDGNNAAPGAADDGAIATDKSALRTTAPGSTTAATFENYTSYSRGINGIMVDIGHLPNAASSTIGVADFSFKVGNDSTPGDWGNPAAPPSVTVRAGAGVGGSDRVTIIWADGAISKQWLQVTVLATAKTGLTTPDIFYFGNAVGEAGIGNNPGFANISPADELAARANPRSLLNPAPINNPYDFNRDWQVNPADQLIARANPTSNLNALQLIVLVGPPAAPVGAGDQLDTVSLVTTEPLISDGEENTPAADCGCGGFMTSSDTSTTVAATAQQPTVPAVPVRAWLLRGWQPRADLADDLLDLLASRWRRR